MAGQSDLNSGGTGVGGNGSHEVRTHFSTREGVYKMMTLAEYSRPNRIPSYNPIQSVQQQGGAGVGQGANNPHVRVTLVTLPSDPLGFCDRITFNHGRELYFYAYKGVKKPADLSKPIDKRIYKGTSPTCHDINKMTISSESVMLLVGFTGGQIQLVDPIRKEVGKLYNEERIIEKTKVTCIKWIPDSPNLFLVSHASGQMYLYNEEATCGGPTPPTYQLFKQGSGFSVWTCKSKSTRNPIYRWIIGDGAINDFAFSPCSKYLAVVSQDGCLRVLNYDSMELIGLATSFFGGFLCVCWSPDGQLVVAGGEDDLVTVWSFQQRRIVARGEGHRSWVTVVAFDPYTTTYSESVPPEGTTLTTKVNGVDDETQTKLPDIATCYRLGSVAMDTQLCLWELTDDVLKQLYGCRSRTSMVSGPGSPPSSLKLNSQQTQQLLQQGAAASGSSTTSTTPPTNNSHHAIGTSLTQRLANSLTFAERRAGTMNTSGHEGSTRKNLSFTGRSSNHSAPPTSSSTASSATSSSGPDRLRLMGTGACPRLDEVPKLEPLVCKKIAQERLTALVFREDCLITACQDGIICTWARPSSNAPPHLHHSSGGGGTMTTTTTTSEGTMV